MTHLTSQNALTLWRDVLLAQAKDMPDLSARQMSLLLTVYLKLPPHTVRGLASALRMSKPAVTRALDALSRLDLVKRKRDDADRRNVLVQRTVKGSIFLGEFADAIVEKAEQLKT